MAWWSVLIDPIAKVFQKGLDIIDELVEDKDEANAIKAALEAKFQYLAHTELITVLDRRADIILAEIKGQSWLQRNWRPLLMITVILIIFNNFALLPYGQVFWPDKVAPMELPGGLWALLNTGTTGYLVARTVEKVKGATGTIIPKIG